MKDQRPPLPADKLEPAAVYWLQLFECTDGWASLVHHPKAQWTRLVRCDDPADAPLIAGFYKQNGGLGVHFAYTDREGVPHHA